jgi:hemerythrin-like metal-binding protein
VLSWHEDRHALGVAEMDATHREFVAAVAALAAAGDDAFPGMFQALAAHTRAHFDNESRLMRQCRFPAIAEHEGEHRRVLGEVAWMERLLGQGRIAPVRMYVAALPEWFALHLATMDAALAACLKRG